MTPAEVSSAVMAAAGAVVPGVGVDAAVRCHADGSYGSPVALKIAAETGRTWAEVAEGIAGRLRGRPGVRSVRIDGGFLTIFVEGPGALADAIVAAGGSYARADVPGGHWADRPRTFENPGFGVRFAYARAAAVRRRAGDLGVRAGEGALLAQEEELRLLGLLGELPRAAGRSARERDPGPLMRHLERIAAAYHRVYERCPALPVGEEKPGAMHGARLTLAEAVRIAIANGLEMTGETPRERI